MSPVPSSASLSSMIQPEQLEQMPRAGGSAVSADWYLNEGNPAKADPEKSFPTLMLRGFDISLKNYREGCKRLIDMMDGTKVENWDFAKNNDGSPVERHCLRLRSLFGSAFETDLPVSCSLSGLGVADSSSGSSRSTTPPVSRSPRPGSMPCWLTGAPSCLLNSGERRILNRPQRRREGGQE